MNNHKEAIADKSITENPPYLERRTSTTLVAALTLLGMGLGVNLEEARAGMEKVLNTQNKTNISKPSVDYGKIGTSKPSVAQDKTGAAKPSVGYWKLENPNPSVDMHKLKNQQNAPTRPGVTRVKPVPAATQKLQGEIDEKK